jgi:hypothetical protein
VAVPISLVSGIALYLITQHSDKSRQRHLSSMACALAAAFGFTMVLVGDTFDQPWVAYVGLMIATSGAIANVPLTTVGLACVSLCCPTQALLKLLPHGSALLSC